MPANRLLSAYYLITPAFAALDFLLAAPIRAAAIPSPGVRWAYYGVCFALGFVVRRWPASGPWLGMGESLANFTLLLAGIMSSVYGMADSVLAGGDPVLALQPGWPLGALLSGGVLIYSFRVQQHRLLAGGSRGGQRTPSARRPRSRPGP